MNIIKPKIFAPISQFVYIAKQQEIGIALHMDFNKSVQCNQLEIATTNGLQKLSIHLNRQSLKQTIMEVETATETTWKKELLKSIETAYRKAPFYEFYDYKILPLFELNNLGLAIQKSYELICELLDINTKLIWTEEKPTIEPCENAEYNQVFMPNKQFVPNCSVLDILFNQGPMAEDIIKNGAAI